MCEPFVGFFDSREEMKEIKEQSIILYGIPYEGEKQTPKGCAKSPSLIRRFSVNNSGISVNYNIHETKTMCYDFGDIDITKKGENKRISKIWQLAKKTNSKIIMIGGDHYSTYFSLSKAELKNIGLIWLDAHADLAKEYPPGVKRSHATIFHNLLKDEKITSEQLMLIGGHSYSQSKEEFDIIKEDKINFIPTSNIIKNTKQVKNKILSFMDRYNNVCLSIDLDILDQCYVPTLSVPEPFGLSPHDLLEVLELILPNAVYVDIVETRVSQENNLVLNLVVHLIYEIIRIWDKI